MVTTRPPHADSTQCTRLFIKLLRFRVGMFGGSSSFFGHRMRRSICSGHSGGGGLLFMSRMRRRLRCFPFAFTSAFNSHSANLRDVGGLCKVYALGVLCCGRTVELQSSRCLSPGQPAILYAWLQETDQDGLATVYRERASQLLEWHGTHDSHTRRLGDLDVHQSKSTRAPFQSQ